ncbi:MAG: metallophosphoesterase [Moraxella sp.]|nr:metallophosphoesterase [Moraxella sp.]
MIYDIIGDIHGRADKLTGLLTQLGYVHDGTSFVAPIGHKAVFIGDLVDRGNQQLATLQIVFDMLDNAQALAIMGNHEYNAIAYATPNPHKASQYLREHTPHNTHQHQAFLDEVGFGTDLHRYWLGRLYELPLVIELPKVIFVHACYDELALATLSPFLHDNRLSPATLPTVSQCGTAEFIALERLLKGIELPLPHGSTMTDKTGIVRTRARVKWWLDNWQHRPINEALLADDLPDEYFDDLPMDLQDFAIATDKPIFVGHYWLDGTPAMLSPQVVCVDYSAGKDGHLTAYQFNTDKPTLDNRCFVQFKHF